MPNQIGVTFMEKPIYQKIIDDMLRDINNGQLEVGMKIPS